MKKLLVTLLATGLLGSAIAAGSASASTGPTIKCDLHYGCWHN